MSDSEYLTRVEAADCLRLSEKTLRNWASMDPPRGPTVKRVGRQVRYIKSEIYALARDQAA